LIYQKRKNTKTMKPIVGIVVALTAVAVLFIVAWVIFFRKKYTLLELLLLPFKLLLRIFGIGVAPPNLVPVPIASPPQVDVNQHLLGTCPPCDVKCPDIPKPEDCKPLELEISYLKKMVKFIGAMAKRENAINAQYREIYPGFSVMSPAVRRLSYEYNYMKNEIRDDENEWTYFKNYFTKLSGIPSTSSAVHYDLTM